MGKLDQVNVVLVDVVRNDGSGRADANNPHPEGKVPFLVTDEGEEIRESAAIMMYLDELYGAPLSIPFGETGRGKFLSWMMYYGGVVEPAMVAHYSEISHPAMIGTFRTMTEVGECLAKGLGDKQFLLGDKITLSDIIMASAFQWAPHLTPDFDNVKSWFKRVNDALDLEALQVFEARGMETLKKAI
jgi:glutathione S-transferase